MENTTKEIQQLFNRVLQASQNQYIALDQMETDQIFTEWEKNKEWFLSRTSSPVLEIPDPVCFELDKDSCDNLIDNFLNWVYDKYGEPMYLFFRDNRDGLMNNRILEKWHDYPNGTRLSKVLMKEFGGAAEEARQRLSMLIQENKVTGKFCISVHPLDFLSASENTHNWRSCHALDGEYRVGNVSYMMDGCTFMAYLKSDAPDTKLPNFPSDVPWNSKKWRCYFYLDRENKIAYAGKQYPFSSDSALRMVEKVLYDNDYFFSDDEKKEYVDEANGRCWWGDKTYSWEDLKNIDFIHGRKFLPVGLKGQCHINGIPWDFAETKVIVSDRHEGSKVVPVTRYIENDPDACCFNDVYQSHTYAPYVMVYNPEYGERMPPKVDHKLIVGKGVKCICCGDRLTSDSDNFFCERCRNDETECCRCGCVEERGYMHYIDGEWYCDDCYQDLTAE